MAGIIEMRNTESRSGYILALVMGILLVLGILLSALLRLPGGVRHLVVRESREVQKVYDAESALLLHLEYMPAALLPGIPPVYHADVGPYGRLCSGNSSLQVCVMTVSALQELGFGEWLSGVQAYRARLREGILSAPGLRRYSGNRRFFDVPGNAYMQVSDGDLRLDFPGSLKSRNAYVGGDVIVEGDARFDTLRIFSLGNVKMGGNVRMGFLEAVGNESVEIGGQVHFRGIVVAGREILLQGKAVAEYPSMAIAIGHNGTSVTQSDGVVFSGLRASLPGNIAAEDSVMPSFLGGPPVVFEREVLR